eukprot:7883856-Ditylum_brightwellii.AAC.1
MVLGNYHIDVAVTDYNAGQTYHQKGYLTKAIKLYQKVLNTACTRLGNKHRDVAIMLKHIAVVHHETKEYEKATDLCSEAKLSIGSLSS